MSIQEVGFMCCPRHSKLVTAFFFSYTLFYITQRDLPLCDTCRPLGPRPPHSDSGLSGHTNRGRLYTGKLHIGPEKDMKKAVIHLLPLDILQHNKMH